MDCLAPPIRVPVARRPPGNKPVADGELWICLMTASEIGVGFGYPPRQPANAGRTERPVRIRRGNIHHEYGRASAGDRNRSDRTHRPSSFYRDMNLPERA